MPYATGGDGTRLFYERFGRDGGRTVLLIMGLGANGRIWRPVVDRLVERDYDVLTFDNRGCGRSGVPLRPWTTRTMAADAIAVADDAGVAVVDLIGASLGGMVAQEVAIGHPQRIRTLVLGCTTGGLPRVDLLPLRGMPDVLAALLRSGRRPASARDGVGEFLSFVVSPDFAASCEEGSEAWRAVAGALDDPMTQRGFAQQFLAAARHSTWSRLDRLTMPVQIQHGSADRLMPPAAGRELARRIPGADLKILEGAGHALGLERPDEIVDVAVTFVESRSKVPA
jgi:pimeloyl-ACP methyl ester carboxylesterase